MSSIGVAPSWSTRFSSDGRPRTGHQSSPPWETALSHQRAAPRDIQRRRSSTRNERVPRHDRFRFGLGSVRRGRWSTRTRTANTAAGTKLQRTRTASTNHGRRLRRSPKRRNPDVSYWSLSVGVADVGSSPAAVHDHLDASIRPRSAERGHRRESLEQATRGSGRGPRPRAAGPWPVRIDVTSVR